MMVRAEVKLSAKGKILNAALAVIRSQGYSATTVDDLCAAAGVTKGAFFHHFQSKEDLAIAAAKHWSSLTTSYFQSAPYQKLSDPLDRVRGYLDFRKSLLRGPAAEFTCLVGTMVQETFDSSPAIREACHASIFGHSLDVARDIQLAKDKHSSRAKWSSKSLALYFQAVLQGSFILAKSDQDPAIAADCVDHLRAYVEHLFQPSPLKTRRNHESKNRNHPELRSRTRLVPCARRPTRCCLSRLDRSRAHDAMVRAQALDHRKRKK